MIKNKFKIFIEIIDLINPLLLFSFIFLYIPVSPAGIITAPCFLLLEGPTQCQLSYDQTIPLFFMVLYFVIYHVLSFVSSYHMINDLYSSVLNLKE